MIDVADKNRGAETGKAHCTQNQLGALQMKQKGDSDWALFQRIEWRQSSKFTTEPTVVFAAGKNNWLLEFESHRSSREDLKSPREATFVRL